MFAVLLNGSAVQHRVPLRVASGNMAQFDPPVGIGRGFRLALDYSEVFEGPGWIETNFTFRFAPPVVSTVFLDSPVPINGYYRVVVVGRNLGLEEEEEQTRIEVLHSGIHHECVRESVGPTKIICLSPTLEGDLRITVAKVEGPVPPYDLVPQKLLKPVVLSWAGAAACSEAVIGKAASNITDNTLVMEEAALGPDRVQSKLAAEMLVHPFPTEGRRHALAVAGLNVLSQSPSGDWLPIQVILIPTNTTIASGGFIDLKDDESIVRTNSTLSGKLPSLYWTMGEDSGNNSDAREAIEELIRCQFGCYEIPAKIVGCSAKLAAADGVYSSDESGQALTSTAATFREYETSIVVDLPPGQGLGWEIMVRVGEDLSATSIGFSFSPPFVDEVLGDVDAEYIGRVPLLPTAGSWIEIRGGNFGQMATPSHFAGSSDLVGSVSLYDVMDSAHLSCDVLLSEGGLWEQQRIRCVVGEGFSSPPHTELVVTVSGVTMTQGGLVGFKPPTIQQLNDQVHPTQGGVRISMNVTDIGIHPHILVGERFCTDVQMENEGVLSCLLPEGSGLPAVVVQSHHQRSTCKEEDQRCHYKYQPPLIHSFTPAVLVPPRESRAPTVIKIEGESLGPPGVAKVRFWEVTGLWTQQGCTAWDGIQPNPQFGELFDPQSDVLLDDVNLDGACQMYYSPRETNVLVSDHYTLEVLAPLGLAQNIKAIVDVDGQQAELSLVVQQ